MVFISMYFFLYVGETSKTIDWSLGDEHYLGTRQDCLYALYNEHRNQVRYKMFV